MVHVSAKTFAENCIFTIIQLKKGKEPVLWIRIKDIGETLDVKNIFDLVDKEMKGKFNILVILQSNKSKNTKDVD